MNRTSLIVLIFIVIVAVGAYLVFVNPAASDAALARAAVTNFGSHLADVSLLATSTDVVDAMHNSYAPYVDANLLAAWDANPAGAPGRLTSSPWPARIDTVSSALNADGTYTVRGTVAEETSTGPSGTYPVTATVANENGTWLITQFSGYPPVTIPATGPITVSGTMTCLLHKDTSGPQTLECAIGLKEDGTGRYFAINDQAATGVGMLGGNEHVTVSGSFTPASSDTRYQEVGTITVTSYQKQ
jgi:hypothetical protein